MGQLERWVVLVLFLLALDRQELRDLVFHEFQPLRLLRGHERLNQLWLPVLESQSALEAFGGCSLVKQIKGALGDAILLAFGLS